MNHEDPRITDDTDDTDDALRQRLRALPRELAPPGDGWTRLQAALPPRPPIVVDLPRTLGHRRSVRRRLRWAWPAGAALAASLALYWVVPQTTQPRLPEPGAPSVLQQQASAMSADYQQAIAALPRVDAPEWRPALRELDDSADQIHAALAQSPRSRHLLEQLQRTYALRLELTRQAATSATGLPS